MHILPSLRSRTADFQLFPFSQLVGLRQYLTKGLSAFPKGEAAITELIINKLTIATVKNAKVVEELKVYEQDQMGSAPITIQKHPGECHADCDNAEQVLTSCFNKQLEEVTVKDTTTNTFYRFSQANILNNDDDHILIQGDRLTINS